MKKQICDRLKGPDSRTNKKHECSLGYKRFSWVEAVSYWWSNINLLGLSIRRKISALLLQPFLVIPRIQRAWTRLCYKTASAYGKLRVNLSLPYSIHESIKWPPIKEVKWLHPKMNSREIKVLYLNVCFPHTPLHWPVVECIFFRKAVWGIWIKISFVCLCS